MPTPKRFTDDELRVRKNAQAKRRYHEDTGYREKCAEYHAALYASRKDDPEFLKKMAERAAEQRKRNPGYTKIANAARRAKDPEKARAENRAWFAKNREKRSVYEENRRVKKAGGIGKVSTEIIQELMKSQKGKCVCCRISFDKAKRNIDHIIPLALGGKHEKTNLQLLCKPCNNSKYSKHPIDFMQERGFLL